MEDRKDARHGFLHRYAIPADWKRVTLGDLAEVIGGATPSRNDHRYWNSGTIQWATPTDITKNPGRHITSTKEMITELGLASSATRLLPPGTILFTSRATIGARAIASCEITTNQGFSSFVPKSCNGEYLYSLLELLTPFIKRLGCGTTFDEVSKRDVRQVWCSVPPPKEQAAIARVLEAVDTAIGRAQDVVEETQNLKHALVQEFIFAALGETAYADRPTQILPPGWHLIPFGDLIIGLPKNGLSPTTQAQPPGIPTFSIAAVRNGKIDLSTSEHLKYAQITEKVATPYKIDKGDFLIVRGNANPDLVGKAGIVDSFPLGCIYPDITKRIVFCDEGEQVVLPEYALLIWNNPVVHNQILRRAKTSNGTLKINNLDVKQAIIPVPPIDEQRELIKRAEVVEQKISAVLVLLKAQKNLKRSLMHDLLTGRHRIPPEQIEALAKGSS